MSAKMNLDETAAQLAAIIDRHTKGKPIPASCKSLAAAVKLFAKDMTAARKRQLLEFITNLVYNDEWYINDIRRLKKILNVRAPVRIK